MNAFSIRGKVRKFPGNGGWHYLDVPKKYTKELKEIRVAWGMYPIQITLGRTTWQSKLMMKKGGAFFIALKASVRKKERVAKGDTVTLSCTLL